MNERVLKTLEYNKIINRLADMAASDMGRELCEKLVPMNDIKQIRQAQRETSEAVSMILKKGSLGLGGLRNIKPYLERAEIGGSLGIEELLHIADFIRVSARAKGYAVAEGKNDSFPTLEPTFNSIEVVSALQREIERCITSPTELADDASHGLRDIRRHIKIANDRIKEQLNSIIHSASYKDMLQDSVITIRNDRYCVPVKQEYKNAFSGMIHDQSATGATVFIEPISVVQLNNKIAELKNKEKSEIDRILALLSDKVSEYSQPLMVNLELLAHIDFVFAKGELSIAMRGTEPVFNERGYINLKKARHPLLNPDTVVPTDIYIGKDFTTLLITGPNTGGKTVSLKTLGLFTLMGQAGLHIAAFDNSELAVFEEVFADIGDEQSIEQSLSTFSAHMTNIVRILDNVTNNSLVLIDELGAGTDPTEGAALAIALIKYLHALGVRTAVTTHYSELKVYALSADGVENASCEFDVRTLRPTYRLLIGVPGKSNAFAISKRLGLPDYIIEEAKNVISHEDIRFEDVITDLEISRKALIAEQEKAEEYRAEAERLRAEAQKQRERLNAARDKIIREANEKARTLVSDAKDEADSILKEMRRLQKQGGTKQLEEQRDKLKNKMSAYQQLLEKKRKKDYKVPNKLNKGDKVLVHSLGQTGFVSNPPDKNGDVLVRAGIMNIKININDLSLVEDDEPIIKNRPQRFNGSINRNKAGSVSAELDLRGLMVAEALDRLDKYIDDAYLAGLSPVTVIHGKGTGALRKAVQDYCKTSPNVSKYRDGAYGEGDLGVTVIELK